MREKRNYTHFRRHYFVHKQYQGRFIFFLILLTLTVGIITALSVYRKTKNVLSEAPFQIHVSSSEIWDMIQQPLYETNSVMSGISIIIAVSVIFLILFNSSRILRSIEKEIQAIDSGEDPKIVKISEPLISDLSRKTSEALKHRLYHFQEAADLLDHLSSTTLYAETEESINNEEVIQEIDDIISEIDRGVNKFKLK